MLLQEDLWNVHRLRLRQRRPQCLRHVEALRRGCEGNQVPAGQLQRSGGLLLLGGRGGRVDAEVLDALQVVQAHRVVAYIPPARLFHNPQHGLLAVGAGEAACWLKKDRFWGGSVPSAGLRHARAAWALRKGLL